MALALLHYSLRQMVVENQPPEHRQVEQGLQQDNKTRTINAAFQLSSDVGDWQLADHLTTVVIHCSGGLTWKDQKRKHGHMQTTACSLINTEYCSPCKCFTTCTGVSRDLGYNKMRN